ncbi:hypothetical protein GUJ93_ZPchr0002g26416 [Zizania palustris]|uniref:Uncharacterized protein n=1 Tax=Zizania palustris TaxID=103762 RepID=A0A8J5SEX6_ZIZPA|nr:hypothetical protein GUJ93_ZPchr0002g26416 [Zizania palustris]
MSSDLAFALLHGASIIIDRQEVHAAEGIKNFQHQALEAIQRWEHAKAVAETVVKASKAEEVEACEVVAIEKSEAEGLWQAHQASNDEAERFKAEAEELRA